MQWPMAREDIRFRNTHARHVPRFLNNKLKKEISQHTSKSNLIETKSVKKHFLVILML